jgi:hypothetical protein
MTKDCSDSKEPLANVMNEDKSKLSKDVKEDYDEDVEECPEYEDEKF